MSLLTYQLCDKIDGYDSGDRRDVGLMTPQLVDHFRKDDPIN